MQIPVLIEAVPTGGFQARGGEPFPVVASGATPQDALAQFKTSVADKLQAGAHLASVEIQATDPWATFAGMYSESDSVVKEWLDIVRDERNRVEEAE